MTNVNQDLERDRVIARRLPHSWPAFFDKFGRLTPVQRDAIPIILDGKDTLVISATASGKTEAVCAPLVERNIGRNEPWTILYITPTRALVNDLYGRLWQPLENLSLSVKRRTGDHKERIDSAHVILTTPESFDSLLCRGRIRGPAGHALAHVVALVLDEVHLLHGSARGEQVRWLIERLRRLRRESLAKGWVRSEDFQIVALSATVPDPEDILTRFLPGGTIVRIPGGRAIDSIIPPSSSIDAEQALPTYLRATTRPEKILVFSNSRRRVDDLAARLSNDLKDLGYATRAHHGSLDRKVRESTEDAVKNSSKIAVFCTSTLELGIDIGDIDLVVLDGPAHDIRSLLQRIGRGNRRTNTTRVMTCAGSFLEIIVHDAMIQASREGWLGDPDHGPQYAVARQQVISYIFQSSRRSKSRDSVQSLLDKCADEVVSRTLIDEMLRRGELHEDQSGLTLGDDWLEKAASGQIHSTIETIPGAEVIDEQTGQSIASGLLYHTGRGLNMGGLPLEAIRWNERKLEVRRLKDTGLVQGNWGYTSRAWFKGSDQPTALRIYLGIPENTWPVIKKNGLRFVFHFGGAKRKAIIQLAASSAQPLARISVNEWYLTVDGANMDKPKWIQDTNGWDIELQITSKLKSLERTLGRPIANQFLPLEARVREVKEWLHVRQELDCLKSCTWTSDIDEETMLILQKLADEL